MIQVLIYLLCIFAACGIAFFLYLGVPLLFRLTKTFELKVRAARARSLALTFDDGPADGVTSDVLGLLTEFGCSASFFMLGDHIAGREALVRQIASQGHEVCSHGYRHLDHWKVSPVRAIADIKAGWRAIDRALNVRGRVYPFRPPDGRLTLFPLLFLLWKHAPIVYWTADSADTWNRARPRDPLRVAKALGRYGGAVALYHDFERRDRQNREFMLTSFRLTLRTAKERGIKCVTVSELFGGTPS